MLIKHHSSLKYPVALQPDGGIHIVVFWNHLQGHNEGESESIEASRDHTRLAFLSLKIGFILSQRIVAVYTESHMLFC